MQCNVGGMFADMEAYLMLEGRGRQSVDQRLFERLSNFAVEDSTTNSEVRLTKKSAIFHNDEQSHNGLLRLVCFRNTKCQNSFIV